MSPASASQIEHCTGKASGTLIFNRTNTLDSETVELQPIVMSTKKHFHQSLIIAIRGAIEASLSERNLKIQWVIAANVVVAGVFFELQMWEWCFVILSIGAVISAEIMNTAIESLVNLLEPDQHESARKAKDFAAGSVLLISIAAGVIGLVIFGNHLMIFLKA